MFLRSVEVNVLNARIDATASGSLTTYGVIIEEIDPGERFSLVRNSDISGENAGSGNAIGAEFRGNGSGGILNSVVGSEAATGSGMACISPVRQPTPRLSTAP